MSKIFRFLIIFLVITGGILFYFPYIKAASFNLYPGSCLGSWQNPYLAQGRPDGDGTMADKENSAIFSEGGVKEIYCGSFNGDLSEGEIKLIKSVNLKFSWLVSDEELATLRSDSGQAATSSITIIQPPATSSEAVVQNTSDVINEILNNIHADEVSVIVSTTTLEIMITTNNAQQTIPTPVEDGVGTPTESVGAENTAAIVSEIEEPQTTTSSPMSFWWRKYDFFFADDQVSNTAVTTSDVVATATTSSLDSPLAPTEDFLKVSYTLDGINWQALGTVNKNNWQDAGFGIPVYQLEDVKKIQIKIESLPLINKTPYVYLDGLALQVEYETSLISQSKTPLILSQSSNPKVNPNVSYSRMPSDSNVTGSVNFNISVDSFEDFGFDNGCGLGSQPCNFWGIRAENLKEKNSVINSACVSNETLSHAFNMVLPKADYIDVMIFAGNTQESCEAGGELSKFLEGDSNHIIFSVIGQN